MRSLLLLITAVILSHLACAEEWCTAQGNLSGYTGKSVSVRLLEVRYDSTFKAKQMEDVRVYFSKTLTSRLTETKFFGPVNILAEDRSPETDLVLQGSFTSLVLGSKAGLGAVLKGVYGPTVSDRPSSAEVGFSLVKVGDSQQVMSFTCGGSYAVAVGFTPRSSLNLVLRIIANSVKSNIQKTAKQSSLGGRTPTTQQPSTSQEGTVGTKIVETKSSTQMNKDASGLPHPTMDAPSALPASGGGLPANSDPVSEPSMKTTGAPLPPPVFNPVVGSGLEYLFNGSSSGGARVTFLYTAVVVAQEADGYWIERRTSMQGVGAKGVTVLTKDLMVGNPPVSTRRISVVNGKATEVKPVTAPATTDSWTTNAIMAGTDSVTVPAGTFQCDHYISDANGERTDVWISSKVPSLGPLNYGVVKLTSPRASQVLQRLLEHETSQVREPAGSADGDGLPKKGAVAAGCIAVEDAASLHKIAILGAAGSLVTKKQYSVLDVVDYPARVGQKFHGEDLRIIQNGGTKIVILGKKHTADELQKACHP